jgi:hypothetical protein
MPAGFPAGFSGFSIQFFGSKTLSFYDQKLQGFSKALAGGAQVI